MPTESDNQASSPTSPNDQKNGSKHTTISHDPTAYVARARVTRPEPPKPSYNPMQFVQIKPCNLFKSAQEQLKRAEEVKKVKEIKKEEPEEWQNNLDNWKSSRRKRVEHIIDRVVEVKKLELEEHDRTRRKSATFSEMLEKRGERRGVNKLASLSVYNEDESNDLSDLGIGANSASGKSSISEDFDNHSAMVNNDKEDTNENPENNINNNGKSSNCNTNNINDLVINEGENETNNRDTCEYTYESAIQDYKTRVSRASSNGLFNNNNMHSPTDNNSPAASYNQIKRSSKIEEKLSSFEIKIKNEDSQTVSKTDLPKVDISKRKELFEGQPASQASSSNSQKRLSGEFSGTKSIKERLSNLENKSSFDAEDNKSIGDLRVICESSQNNETSDQIKKASSVSDVPVPSLRDRLSSLQSAVTKEEIKKPVVLIDEQQVALMRKEDEDLLNKQKLETLDESFSSSQELLNTDTDREDSGIHTTDVSCSVSQTDEQPEISHINEDTLQESSSQSETTANLELSVNEALELALKAIDEEGILSLQGDEVEPIYEVIHDEEKINSKHVEIVADSKPEEKFDVKQQIIDDEPYYQVPKPVEPYYEVPKSKKPIPVYENIEIFFPTDGSVLEPPTEKPPPPPPLNFNDDDGENNTNDNSLELYENAPMKRINSTKRIKNEIRNKRSSFLGIDGNIDDLEELSLAPPPDMAQLLQEEKRLEKQLYLKAGLYDSSDTGDSRDSGVSENHSRQSSEPFTNSSEEADRHEDLLIKKEKEIIEVLEIEEEKQKRTYENISEIQASLVDTVDSSKIQSIEEQIREQEEVLRVERELLHLEQEEIKRQRENLILRETITRRDLQNGNKMFMSANPNHRSLQDINNPSNNIYVNLPTNQIYQIDVDYRKSISDLRVGPVPPTKPMRTYAGLAPIVPGGGLVKIATNCYSGSIPAHLNFQPVVSEQQPQSTTAPVRNYQTGMVLQHGNMSRNTLHALSATPKPKYTDAWVNQKQSEKRKSTPNENFNGNYNNHWLIQEAEQRRIEQQRLNQHKRQSLPLQQSINNWNNSNGNTQHHHYNNQQQNPNQISSALIQRNGSYDNKPLPESVIQTITQRVQSKGIGERMKRLEARSTECLTSSKQIPPPGGLGQPLKPLNSIVTDNNNLYSHVNHNSSQYSTQQPQATVSSISDKVLSVSGKKKCSHCGDELGRGAAMIIESLRLFYHINCFKCCVCHIQLGDGLNGTDVRVRNQKLHCQNCYSSEDGIKFSCV